MDDTVRDLLASQAVHLEPVNDVTEIFGFRCLGVAEKALEFSGSRASEVYIWHVKSDILPISRREFERWAIDAPGSRHWILSEREFEPSSLDIIPEKMQVEIWGPEKMSKWIGQAVLRGDLVARAASETPEESSGKIGLVVEEIESKSLSSKVDLEEWLIGRGWDSLSTSPLMLLGKKWIIKGALIGPNGELERNEWVFLEDPWAKTLTELSPMERLGPPLSIRHVNPHPSRWLDESSLLKKLQPMLDERRKSDSSDSQDKVRSMMLEWWHVDVESIELEHALLQIPAWSLNFEGGNNQILHGRNGRAYEID